MPTQSVLDGAKVMRDELKQAQAKAEAMFSKELAAINAGLKKEKLRPINPINKAEWEKQNGKTAAPVVKPF
jgi:hypothetical protein